MGGPEAGEVVVGVERGHAGHLAGPSGPTALIEILKILSNGLFGYSGWVLGGMKQSPV